MYRIFVVDQSYSMMFGDTKPSSKRWPQNRLGAVFAVIDDFVQYRRQQGAHDIFSFIRFDENATLLAVKQDSRNFAKSTCTAEYGYGTNFDAVCTLSKICMWKLMRWF